MKRLTEKPESITAVFIHALAMPNGEIICCGKTVAWLIGNDAGISVFVREDGDGYCL